MADFSYKFDNSHSSPGIQKFERLYTDKKSITTGFDVYYNNHTTTHIMENENGNTLTIMGYVYTTEKDTKAYLSDLLTNFSENRITEAKEKLLGQYTAIFHLGNQIYLFSDFLQTRAIYYNIEDKLACSSLSVMQASKTDDYKAFEFLAMRHCIYPAWLGNTTIYHRIKRVRAYEYLKIDENTGAIEVVDFQFTIDNTKIKSLKEIKTHTLSLLRKSIQHPISKNKKIASTITGGFDSRFVTALTKEYYPDINLRISTYKDSHSLDYTIASQIAKTLALPLDVYETNLQTQKEAFYDFTDGLTPQENAIMTELLKQTSRWDLGFGGAFGTELYTSVTYNTIDESIVAFLHDIKRFIKSDETYFAQFEQALRNEFENIRNHYLLKSTDERDFMRIFRLINTGYFSSQVLSAFNIYGNQFEVFGTFPIIEAGLKIPYEYLGSKLTFGRFYMIPKILVEHLNLKISKISTTHFCPMRPLSISSFIPYVLGKMERKKYYKQQAKIETEIDKPKPLSYITDSIQYTSNDWYEGFMQKYLIDKK